MTKLERINELFFNNVNVEFTSDALHTLFGSAFRSRVSDINKRSWYITIKNRVKDGVSVYWSEWKFNGPAID